MRRAGLARSKISKTSLPRREPLKKRGARSKREAADLERFKQAIYLRCGADPADPFHTGICQECKQARPLHAHHMKTNPRVHQVKFGAGLCFKCHIFGVHEHELAHWKKWLLS